jgi:DNA-binding NarL/FixJ family response regulator
MKADPTAATRALLALAQAQWESDRTLADDKRRAAVLAARAAGMSDQAIADAMGLSRPRVQQIK